MKILKLALLTIALLIISSNSYSQNSWDYFIEVDRVMTKAWINYLKSLNDPVKIKEARIKHYKDSVEHAYNSSDYGNMRSSLVQSFGSWLTKNEFETVSKHKSRISDSTLVASTFDSLYFSYLYDCEVYFKRGESSKYNCIDTNLSLKDDNRLSISLSKSSKYDADNSIYDLIINIDNLKIKKSFNMTLEEALTFKSKYLSNNDIDIEYSLVSKFIKYQLVPDKIYFKLDTRTLTFNTDITENTYVISLKKLEIPNLNFKVKANFENGLKLVTKKHTRNLESEIKAKEDYKRSEDSVQTASMAAKELELRELKNKRRIEDSITLEKHYSSEMVEVDDLESKGEFEEALRIISKMTYPTAYGNSNFPNHLNEIDARRLELTEKKKNTELKFSELSAKSEGIRKSLVQYYVVNMPNHNTITLQELSIRLRNMNRKVGEHFDSTIAYLNKLLVEPKLRSDYNDNKNWTSSEDELLVKYDKYNEIVSLAVKFRVYAAYVLETEKMKLMKTTEDPQQLLLAVEALKN